MSAFYNPNQVCITLDIKNASDEEVQEVIEKLREYSLTCTLFAAEDSNFLRGLESSKVEIALYPDYEKYGKETSSSLSSLKKSYPHAVGGRSHGLMVSDQIVEDYLNCGLHYESNLLLFEHENLKPAIRAEDFVSIPIFWSDEVHLRLKRKNHFKALKVEVPGLKVYRFHPHHIATMPDSVGHLFTELLEFLSASMKRTCCLKEVAKQWIDGQIHKNLLS